jgi:hypothetical protein
VEQAAILRLVSGPKARARLLHVAIGVLAAILFVMLLPVPGASSKSRSGLSNGPISLLGDSLSYSLYSNGLRVDNRYRVTGAQRFYQVLDRSHDLRPSTTWYSEPVGIVYHLTETSPEISSTLLASIRDRASYHFVIDRKGHTWRVVEPLDVANHSGNSIWASEESVYLNLNNSFLGVAFEALTPDGGTPDLGPEQILAGRRLTEVLRSRFGIPAANCVTHAQVSVNPDNLRAGYHTDGANRFPFAELGLPDNYELPVASVEAFGFRYDEGYLNAMGGTPWKGLQLAERSLAENARRNRVDPEDYQKFLQARYRHLFGAFKLTGALDEP